MIMEKFLSEVSDTNRVWIYQANRFLSEQETAIVKQSALQFVQNWAAHGKKLSSGADVIENLFVVVHVDEAQAKASGCSIDSSVHWITALGKDLRIDFLGRTDVAYKDINDSLNLVKLNEFEDLVNRGEIDENTQVFNNMAFSGRDLKYSWLTTVKESWHSRYLPASAVK